VRIRTSEPSRHSNESVKYEKARTDLLELIRQYVELATPDINRGGDLLRRRLSAVKRWREAPGHFDWDSLEFEDQLKKVDFIQNEFRAWIQDNQEESIETLAKRSGLESQSSRTDERMLEFVSLQAEVKKGRIKYDIPTLEMIVSRLDKAVVELEKIVGSESGVND
jgi:hypothetical protein